MENEVLAFVKSISKNTDGTFEYDFFFSTTPEFVWGPDWDINSPVSNGDITPDSTTYNEIKRVVTNLPLKTLAETSCYSMEYATYGIMALAWIDIENLDEYPENGRLTMYFGETKDEIIEKLNKYSWNFNN
jgi:hypothetical protein